MSRPMEKQTPSLTLSQGEGVPEKGAPAIAAIDPQLGNRDSYRASYCTWFSTQNLACDSCRNYPTVDRLQRLLEPPSLGSPHPGSDFRDSGVRARGAAELRLKWFREGPSPYFLAGSRPSQEPEHWKARHHRVQTHGKGAAPTLHLFAQNIFSTKCLGHGHGHGYSLSQALSTKHGPRYLAFNKC